MLRRLARPTSAHLENAGALLAVLAPFLAVISVDYAFMSAGALCWDPARAGGCFLLVVIEGLERPVACRLCPKSLITIPACGLLALIGFSLRLREGSDFCEEMRAYVRGRMESCLR